MSPKSLLISGAEKRTLWTWRGAASKVTERSANVETLSLYIAKLRVQRRVETEHIYSFFVKIVRHLW